MVNNFTDPEFKLDAYPRTTRVLAEIELNVRSSNPYLWDKHMIGADRPIQRKRVLHAFYY